MWPHTVAILVGGQSARMGAPKHEVVLPSGQTMMDTMLAFAHLVSKKIILVGADIKGQRCLEDHRPKLGPVAGLESLLTSNVDERYLVVGCDMVLLKPETVRPLFLRSDAIVFSGKNGGNEPSPLPLVISSVYCTACSAYLDSGRRSLRGFLREINCTVIPRPIGIEDQLSSINTPDQLNNCSIE